MNKQFRGGIIYLVIVLVIMYFIMSITSFGKSSSSYGYSDFLNDFQAGNVTKVEISQNAEVPTGIVKVTFTGDSGRSSERFNVNVYVQTYIWWLPKHHHVIMRKYE